ncbi:MAG: methyltransferase domain-containing protein [Desulfonauticus sp.]|nr:methyltransferase domain-containing protein [Desulfonauticus sp.]
MKKQIANFFNKGSKHYSKEAIIQKYVAKKCISKIEGKYFPYILEIGAGGNILTSLIQRQIKTKVLVAIDISSQMLSYCTNGIKIIADGEYAPFKPNSFDLVLSSSAMQWYNFAPASIQNNISLVKTGGQYSFAFFIKGTLKELETISKETQFGSIFHLQTQEKYLKFFKNKKIKFNYEIETKKIYFPSVKDILKHLQKTGTNYTTNKYRYGKEKYKNFCKLYTKKYSKNNSVFITYKILYIWGYKE